LAEKKVAGVRINALAKELGVESKAILNKLKEEGLGDVAPNHMSVIKMGLAASVREWFSEGLLGASTAVETGAHVEVKKTARKKKADQAEGSSDIASDGGSMTAVAERPSSSETETALSDEATTAEHKKRKAPPKAAAPAPSDEPMTPVMKEIAPSAPAAPEAPVAPVAPPVIAPPAPVAPVVIAPAAPAAPTKPQTPPTTHSAPPAHAPQQNRPTITLANRPGQSPAPHKAERKPVTPAAKLVTPEPAKMSGPRVVREEKPDVVSAPKPRRTMGADAPPAFLQARPQQGRGVKVSDDDEEESRKAAAKGKSLSSRRRGPDGRRGEAEEKLREFTEADLIERRDRLNAAASYRTGFDQHLKRSESRGTHVQAKTAVERGGAVEIEEPITIKTLSRRSGREEQRHPGQAPQEEHRCRHQSDAGPHDGRGTRPGVRP